MLTGELMAVLLEAGTGRADEPVLRTTVCVGRASRRGLGGSRDLTWKRDREPRVPHTTELDEKSAGI